MAEPLFALQWVLLALMITIAGGAICFLLPTASRRMLRPKKKRLLDDDIASLQARNSCRLRFFPSHQSSPSYPSFASLTKRPSCRRFTPWPVSSPQAEKKAEEERKELEEEEAELMLEEGAHAHQEDSFQAFPERLLMLRVKASPRAPSWPA